MDDVIKVLLFGSYFNRDNDIISLMNNSLSRINNITLKVFDPKLYSTEHSNYVNRIDGVNWIKNKIVKVLVKDFRPNIIICIAGGLAITETLVSELKQMGVILIGIALSDPDDFESRSKHFAMLFDKFYTNSYETIKLYNDIGCNAQLLPFAADEEFHYPLKTKKKYDIVVVGEKRPDREIFISQLKKKRIKVHCYGKGWRSHIWEKLGFSTEVHGSKHREAINSGKIYLSFAQTMAGYKNVKVGIFEAAACGACIVVESFPDIEKYFVNGENIILYNTLEDAIIKITYLIKNQTVTEKIGDAARQKILQSHTWKHRWQEILRNLPKSQIK